MKKSLLLPVFVILCFMLLPMGRAGTRKVVLGFEGKAAFHLIREEGGTLHLGGAVDGMLLNYPDSPSPMKGRFFLLMAVDFSAEQPEILYITPLQPLAKDQFKWSMNHAVAAGILFDGLWNLEYNAVSEPPVKMHWNLKQIEFFNHVVINGAMRFATITANGQLTDAVGLLVRGTGTMIFEIP